MLRGSVYLMEQIRRGTDMVPGPTSPAVLELAEEPEWARAGVWGLYPVRQAHRLPVLFLAYAENAWRGLDHLLEFRPTSRVAVAATTRAGIEHASRSWWLQDPDLDVRGRVARHMNERISGLLDMGKLPDHVQEQLIVEGLWRDEEAAGDWRERLDEIRSVADDLRLPVVKNTWLLEERPGHRALVRQLFDWSNFDLGATVYSYYSSISHPSTMGVASGTVFNEPESTDPVGAISASPEFVFHLLVGAALSYLAASDRLVLLMEWEGWEWEGWQRHARQQVAEAIEARQESDGSSEEPPV